MIVIKQKKNNVEHWEVEIELERIAMQANCVRDNHNNSIMVIGIKRVQLNDLNIPITHALIKNQDQTVLIDQQTTKKIELLIS